MRPGGAREARAGCSYAIHGPLQALASPPRRPDAWPRAPAALRRAQVDETELPEEAEGVKAEQHAAERSFKRARRPQREPTAALAAAALATPSPARAVAMYPCLTTDYDEYAKALKAQGLAPMPLPEYVAMMTRRERPAGAAQPPPRLTGALLGAE